MNIPLRVLAAAGLGVDAFYHLRLAKEMDSVKGSISEGWLFRVESVAAIAVALLILLWGRRISYGLAFLVAASALGAVLLYRYVDVGRLGPLPDMYEPVWYSEKALSAAGEAVAALAALGLLVVSRRRVGRARQSVGEPV